MIPPSLSILLLLERWPAAGWPALAALLAARPGWELVLVGHGDPEALAEGMRVAAASVPGLRAVLHTRPLPASQALVAGVRQCRAARVLLLDPRDLDADWLSASGEPSNAELAGGEYRRLGGHRSQVFPREGFLQLPQLPWMHRLLPVLFACRHPAPAGAGGSLARGVCRTLVRLAGTMGLGRTPARRSP